MRDPESRAGRRVAVAAAGTSVVLALFVPYGHPWASLASALVACAAALWILQRALRPSSMSEVIDGVEAERTRLPAPLPGSTSGGVRP